MHTFFYITCGKYGETHVKKAKNPAPTVYSALLPSERPAGEARDAACSEYAKLLACNAAHRSGSVSVGSTSMVRSAKSVNHK